MAFRGYNSKRAPLPLLMLSLLISAVSSAQDANFDRQTELFFESKIRPVLVQHCYECHSVDTNDPGGALRLDSRDAWTRGGVSGPAIVPGKPTSSLVLQAMRQSDARLVMPPSDHGPKLDDRIIADFEAWIRAGAYDPRSVAEGDLPASSYDDAIERAKQWWAWQPLSQAIVTPAATLKPSDVGPLRERIDNLVRAQQTAAGIDMSPAAELATLVRRLTFDLTGLPPTLDQLRMYALDSDPRPIDLLVDELLNSPHYGERMGRHWLDVARYAESTGMDVNVTYPYAYRYRDYVVDAFTDDLPFDRFILEQVAGDLLPCSSDAERARQSIATGFLAVGPKSLGEMNPRQFAVDMADEQIDAVSKAFLATTIACARCHDHKFDPISQRDYTAMAGIFLSTQTHFGTTGGVAGRNRSDLLELPGNYTTVANSRNLTAPQLQELKARIDELEVRQRELFFQRRSGEEIDPVLALRTGQELVRLQMQLESLDASGTTRALAMGVTDKPRPATGNRLWRFLAPVTPTTARGRIPPELQCIADSPLLIRGELDKPGDIVPRGLPEFLSSVSPALASIPRDQSGRLSLAQWLAGDSNPLTARVIVNRVWLWLMGEGIVTSVDNFGTSGAPPTNPALLDQLALDFIQHDWSIKYLVREIVLSHTYQQSSQWRQTPHEIDPENQLWWRAKPRALEAEELRDGLLAISGSLDRERPHGSLIALAGDGAIGGRRLGGISEADIASAESSHRSLYLPVPRGILPDALEIFDFADNSAVSGKRELTIVPSQSLYWMNSSFVENECEKLAEQTLNELFGTTARSSSDPPASAGRPLGPRRLQAVARWLLTDRTPVGGNQSLPTLTSNEIESAFSKLTRVILSRPPLPDELQATLTYVLESQDKGHAQTKIWTGVCRSLFSSADYRLLR